MIKRFAIVLGGLLLSLGTAMAQTCSVPNSFTSGTTISAAQMNANFTALLACINTAPSGGGLPAAQGRLTLVSGAPVMTSAQTGQTTIYYTPYVGNQIVITTNGTSFSSMSFTELSNVTTNSGTGNAGPAAVVANSNYDLFVWSNGGSLVLTRGPAWTSDTTRGTGAGTTELQRVAGVWTNKIAITNGPGANLGTYVGTIRTDGSSQCNWKPKPSPASGGGNAILGVFNAYNRTGVDAASVDTTTNWAYGTAAWRAANNSTSQRISYIDGLAEVSVSSRYDVALNNGSASEAATGINRDSTSAVPTPSTFASSGPGTFAWPTSVNAAFTPSLGWHYLQAMEYASGSGPSWYGDAIGSGSRYSAQLSASLQL